MNSYPSEAQVQIRNLAISFTCFALLGLTSPAAFSQSATGRGASTKPRSASAPVTPAVTGADASKSIALQNAPADDKPVQLNFEDTPVFGTSTQQLIILMAGKDAVKLPLIRASGGFEVTPTHCDLAPYYSCALSVSYSPKTRGHAAGAIELVFPGGSTRVIAQAHAAATAPDEMVVWLLAVAYLGGLLLFRWNMIAMPDRRMVQAQIAIAKSRAAQLQIRLQPFHAKTHMDSVIALLADAEKAAVEGSKNWLEYLFWTRGREIQSLAMLHAAEAMMVSHFAEEEVRSKLERAESELRNVAKPSAIEIADSIRNNLTLSIGPAAGAQRATVIDIKMFCDQLAGEFAPVVAQFDPAGPDADRLSKARGILSTYATVKIESLAAEIATALKESAAGTPSGLRQLLEEASHLPKKLADLAEGFGATPDGEARERLGVAARAFSDALHLQSSRADAMLSSIGAYPLLRGRALLIEALEYLSGRADSDDAILLSWQNKTLWLTGCAITLIIALSFQHGNGKLFVLGAVGGLLSRLSRNLYRQDLPTDYGAAWTTLFLSVVVGSLAGWAGVLMVQLSVGLGVLGSLFESIEWGNSDNPLAFGLAIVFGFSERAFDTMFTNLQANLFNKQRTPVATAPSAQPLVIATTPAPAAAKAGKQFTHTFKVSGGVPPYMWRLVEPVPDKMKIDPDTGTVTWIPAAPASAPVQVTVRVTDHAGETDTKQFAFTAKGAAP